MKYILTIVVALTCCACQKDNDINDTIDYKSKVIQDVANRFNVNATNTIADKVKAAASTNTISYWKDPTDNKVDDNDIVIDVMTQELIDDLNFTINDFDLDDEDKANAILRLSHIKCKRADIHTAYSSIVFFREKVRNNLINDIIKTGTPIAREEIKDVINEIKDGEDLNKEWIKFAEDSNVEWTDDVDMPESIDVTQEDEDVDSDNITEYVDNANDWTSDVDTSTIE